MEISYSFVYNCIDFDCHLPSGVILLTGKSGCGKSLFLRALYSYFKYNHNRVSYCGYDFVSRSEDEIFNHCVLESSLDETIKFCWKFKHERIARASSPVLLLDNVDLYLTDALLKRLRDVSSNILISCHRRDKFNISDMIEVPVIYEDSLVRVVSKEL